MKKTLIIGFIAVAIGATVLIRKNLIENGESTFADAKSTSYEVRVSGHLDKQKPVRNKDNDISFFMKDSEGRECQVVSAGMRLDSLEQSATIFVKGHMEGNTFLASMIAAQMKP
jgi:cytochrome c-type biogenesis protein CcmE